MRTPHLVSWSLDGRIPKSPPELACFPTSRHQVLQPLYSNRSSCHGVLNAHIGTLGLTPQKGSMVAAGGACAACAPWGSCAAGHAAARAASACLLLLLLLLLVVLLMLMPLQDHACHYSKCGNGGMGWRVDRQARGRVGAWQGRMTALYGFRVHTQLSAHAASHLALGD